MKASDVFASKDPEEIHHYWVKTRSEAVNVCRVFLEYFLRNDQDSQAIDRMSSEDRRNIEALHDQLTPQYKLEPELASKLHELWSRPSIQDSIIRLHMDEDVTTKKAA